MFGWFNVSQQKTYDRFVALAKDGDEILEIGALFGKSTCYLGRKIKASGKKIKLTVVDPWMATTVTKGEDLPAQWRKAHGEDLFPVFQKNIEKAGIADFTIPMQMTSDEAFEHFKKTSKKFRFIMIDGDHSYAQVKKDIINALECVQANGMITGDDYAGKGGVKKAVHDVLGAPPKIELYGSPNYPTWTWRVRHT